MNFDKNISARTLRNMDRNLRKRNKIPDGLKINNDEPIDNMIVDYICRPIAPLFHFTGHTPNMISVYGVCFSIASLYSLATDDILRFTLYLWTAYVLDCLDGYYARKYDMVTDWGDIFEHLRDLLALVSTLGLCGMKYKITEYVFGILFISSALTGIHVGCVQQMYSSVDPTRSLETLDILQFLCFDNSLMYFSNYFGVGMYMIIINTLVLYLSGAFYTIAKILFVTATSVYSIGYVSKTRLSSLDEETSVSINDEDIQEEHNFISVPKELMEI